MVKKIQAIRGMHDILPGDSTRWQFFESVVRACMSRYGYSEVRMPLVEMTDLFKRSIGEVTDIVEKEMYTFEDRNGDSLALRPEGTASCVRAGIEHGFLHNQIQRLWYQGPMFRHERPQKGRYRQFYQVGVEVFGLSGPDIDIELILMTDRFWREAGIKGLKLELNSLGSADERRTYRDALVEYFSAHKELLDEDSLRRLDANPLRILDSKNTAMGDVISGAPRLADYLQEESRTHFAKICAALDSAGIDYVVNPRLVRGLDYYNKTVFEWVTDRLGAQATVCAGGRFDGLVEQLGGRATAAVGFALGMERVMALLEEDRPDVAQAQVDAYLVLSGERAQAEGVVIAEKLRDALPQFTLVTNCGGGSFKNQFKKADKSGARYAIIIGDEEIANNMYGFKALRGGGEQQTLTLDALIDVLKSDNCTPDKVSGS